MEEEFWTKLRAYTRLLYEATEEEDLDNILVWLDEMNKTICDYKIYLLKKVIDSIDK